MTDPNALPLIDSRLDGGVLTLIMQRPAKKNALTRDMYAALSDLLAAADADPAVRVLLIRGAGDAFTAGNDLKDFLEQPPADESSPVVRFLRALCTVRKPLIAAVQGAAVGIGTTLLLHCDLVYAGESARFQLPFVNLGLCPEAASTFLLPLAAGHRRAVELLLFGEPFGALEAQRAGLINRILPDAELRPAAEAAARQLAAKPLAALLVTKELLQRPFRDPVRQAMDAELAAFYPRLRSPEAAEAMEAFFAKRKPDFSRFQ